MAAGLLTAASGGQAQAAATVGFDSNYGQGVVGGDDNSAQLASVPFPMRLFGRTYSTLNISTNGYVILTNVSGLDLSADTFRPNVGGFLGGEARIAPEWFDWVSDTYVGQSASRLMVTWVGTQYGSNVSHIAQMQLFPDGRIVFAYNDPIAPTGIVMTGITTGQGASDPSSSNFQDSSSEIGTRAIYSFDYEDFTSNVQVTFTPFQGIGYHVTGSAPPPPDPVRDPRGGVPEPATWALMIAGFGLAGAALRRRRGFGARAVQT
jgi:hypothetical protein